MTHTKTDRVMETSTTTGTGDFTLTGAVPGFRTFGSVMAVSDTCYYVIEAVDSDGIPTGDWETGYGTYSAANTLTRTSVVRSSNSDSLVSFAAGTKRVALSAIGYSLVTYDWDGKAILFSFGTNAPATPDSGQIGIFARSIAGRQLPAFVGPSGLDSALQPLLARNKVAFYSPYPGATTLTAFGMTVSATGTATAKTAGSSNIYNQCAGVEILVTKASTSAIAGYRLATAAANLNVWRGNAAGLGGFTHVVRFGLPTGVSTSAADRCFVGLSNATAAATDVNPSTLTNIIGVGFDSTDSNWQVMSNDASGTATKVDTGIAIPSTNAADVYEVALFAKPNDSAVTVEFTNVGTGSKYVTTLTTDLPSSTKFMAGRGYHSVGGTSSVVGFGVLGIYHETDL